MNILEKDDLLELKKDLDFKGMYMLLKKHLAGMKFIDLDQSQELKEFLSLWTILLQEFPNLQYVN